MDAKQMAAMCGQVTAGQSASSGEGAGMREQCGQMAAMCGGGDAAGMFEHCAQMAARLSGEDDTADEPEHSEPEGPQSA